MAFENLNPVSIFWKKRGLNYLLFPDGLPKTQPQPAQKPQGAGTWQRKANAGPVPAPTPPAATSQPKAAAAQVNILPQEAWPQPWRDLLAKTKKGLIAWTYWQLGMDLAQARRSGEEQRQLAARRNFLQRMLKDLGHPQGTHTFWPCAMESDGTYAAGRDIFWSALNLLGSRGVIIMGSSAAWPLLQKDKLRPFVQLRENGKFVWILRDIDVLAENEAHYSQSLLFLRQAMLPFVRS